MLNINLIEKLSVKLGFKNKATTVSITDSNNTTVS